MVHAFIMVKTDTGESKTLLGRVLDLDGIVDAHIVAGQYDLIAEADGGAVNNVLGVASSEIQNLDGVLDTKTYISLSAE